ncbi:MAG TPA: DUF3667 domain-containing protein [Lacibacter sp.]|nr:DUF3667 domain-containing protein [Lacibacter sp.]
MSHGNERKEKICLNCNARVFGPYCHVCGQHNIEPRETVLDLVVHFFNDITHFEGKFITSLRYLLFRPGFLTQEYERGRRASYMNPVRMYVFASAFFFILFFSFFSEKTENPIWIKEDADSSSTKIPVVNFSNKGLLEQGLQEAKTAEDSAAVYKVFGTKTEKASGKKDSTTTGMLGITDKTFATIAEYDSAQQALPKEKRDNWLEKLMNKRIIVVNAKYKGDLKAFNKDVKDKTLHSIPKLLFISLPVVAFFLFLLYIRHKRFFYVTHIIFTIHLYVFYFIMLLFLFTSNKIETAAAWWPGTLIGLIIGLYMYIYLYKAMRRLYAQGRAKTILKYLILLFFTVILFALLSVGLFSYTIFNV